MQKTKAFVAATLVVGIAMFPAIAATFQLGAGLSAIARMKGAGIGPTTLEEVGTYEESPRAGPGLRLHRARVQRD